MALLAYVGTSNYPSPLPIVKPLKSTPRANYAYSSCEPYRSLIASYDWDVPTAMRVCDAESHGNPNAVNDNPKTGDYSISLFQINIYGKLAKNRPTEEWLKVPQNNIAYAYKMYSSGGWGQWTTF